MRQLKCDYCHREIPEDDIHFELKLELYASAELPELTEEDLKKDHTAEIEALIEAMQEMDAEELTDEVYECYVFTLCAECRHEIHNRLKHNKEKKHPI
ncbi:hypothetical protein J7M23_12470 [Candidatus Sumerlaeota bacterium]|nr:hypothetical protein [Candidatus Sumerlaeota bacterium]